jgi:AraC-like DNA-binding protein
LEDIADSVQVPYNIEGNNDIEFKKPLSKEQYDLLTAGFSKYYIDIIDNQKTALVQKIKDTIVEMVWNEEDLPNVTTSSYLSSKLHHSYGYLSNLFSEVTFTSIENFIIIQKIERAKQLLLSGTHTLTEISYLLNYSSVAHLSNQFKKTTGLTPSSFQRIIKLRKEK